MKDLPNTLHYGDYIIRKNAPKQSEKPNDGVLFIVCTPIGNLGDISLRALEILSTVDLIACEDTRHSHTILQKLGVPTKTTSYFKFNEKKKLSTLINKLKQGQCIALISDAGTPGLSDPGEVFINEAIKEKISIEFIPGPNAVIPALILSGFPAIPFAFAGYLPPRTKDRIIFLTKYKYFQGTLLFFEVPHRLRESLKDFAQVFTKTPLCVVRELTKIHQEIIRDTAENSAEIFINKTIKGEIVIALDNSKAPKYPILTEPDEEAYQTILDEYETLLKNGLDKKDALRVLSEATGIPKRELYKKLFIKQ